MKKEIINEIFLLRSISCLAVVLIHSIGFALENVDHYNSLDEKMLAIIRTILNFGTPTFIFISEFLLAKSYPDKVPKGFFIKRFKFLLIPYIFMAFFYALIDIQNNEMPFLFSNILIETFKNIFLADYTGYFVVIIFQFYILHTLLNKTLKKYKPTMVLSISLLINLIYLGFFNFTNPLSEYIWYYSSWMPFVGWVFYFTMGYYCGTNYRYFKTLLNKYKLLVYIMPILTLIFVLGLRYTGLLTIPSSKTVGILIFTPAMICLIVHISLKMKRIPYLMLIINNYSFSIYLLHIALINVLSPLINKLSFLNIYLFTMVIFLIALSTSILVAILFNKLPYGKYVIGNIQRSITLPKRQENTYVSLLRKFKII
ncbi:hypothetical protein CHH57_01450 [Niallia circulans]|uniref:Acyltransferase 3 domain-containing protein n=1 Tax=Niallia circulans TaxID=1397 RepID=A0AA91TVP1_NIACI|nr:acyltransferase family protein [Niallia circulans]PAD85004.1 hypothetical protein CHH57_01450 [Niallia circulans]